MLRVSTTARFRAEKEWVFQVILGELLQWPYTIEWLDAEADSSHPAIRLFLPDGKVITVEDHFFSRHTRHAYLDRAHIPDVAEHMPHPFLDGEWLTAIYGRPFVALTAEGAVCGIDLFASAYFMLSRWEEYVCTERDAHGRFPAVAALAFRSGFLHRPVVNEYAALLRCLAERLQANLPESTHQYTIIPTHDVDHPVLWSNGVDRLRTLVGSLVARRNWQEARWWLRGPIWRGSDPYNTFAWLMAHSERKGRRSRFNFMGARATNSDCYYPLDTPFIRNLLKNIASNGHEAGFHPSYESFGEPDQMKAELASLQRLLPDGQRITGGRQHYLRFAAPYTWQCWENMGLHTDGSMGYSEAEGFRCGICRAYPVFNFLTRQALQLREQPLIAMDVTLALYRKYTPDQAISVLADLAATVRKHRGEFVILWHNSSLNTYLWADWERVYESI